MDSATASAQTDPQKPVETPKRLILCFDGTGNAFKGNPGDTNIVKLYNMFDRADDLQMHYYQRKVSLQNLHRFLLTHVHSWDWHLSS